MGITEKADLFTIAQYGDIDAFKKNFKKNDINKKSDIGSGLLHYSIIGGNFDIALFLINNDIDINMVNKEGQTALHYICIYQNIEIAKLLLEKGINVNIRDKYGNNAIWTAVFNCKSKNYEIVELIMKYNPDVETKNNSSLSPSDFAKQIEDEKLINILKGK